MKKNSFIVIILFVVIAFTFINYLIYNNYYNDKIINIANEVIKSNPDINKRDLAHILKKPSSTDNNLLEQYGYNKNNLYLISDIRNKLFFNIILNVLVISIIILIFYIIGNKKNKKRKQEINDLIEYLENINKGNYDIDLNKYNESEFSKLRNTIYKTTVLLKEYNEYLSKDRVILKDNIADISHQLKTPLTASSLMIETLLNDDDISDEKRKDYLNRIYEKNDKICYLVEVLLKLSKLEASTVKFVKEEVKVSTLIKRVLNSTKELALENNIKINLNVDDNIKLICDSKWQEEAIVNIIKNCIEFSNVNGVIDINVVDNNFYTLITIKDYGKGIKKEDINKIFNRFYKNESSKGFGIGLNLAKTIIEKDNGIINVNSKLGEYTMFKIKYIK